MGRMASPQARLRAGVRAYPLRRPGKGLGLTISGDELGLCPSTFPNENGEAGVSFLNLSVVRQEELPAIHEGEAESDESETQHHVTSPRSCAGLASLADVYPAHSVRVRLSFEMRAIPRHQTSVPAESSTANSSKPSCCKSNLFLVGKGMERGGMELRKQFAAGRAKASYGEAKEDSEVR